VVKTCELRETKILKCIITIRLFFQVMPARLALQFNGETRLETSALNIKGCLFLTNVYSVDIFIWLGILELNFFHVNFFTSRLLVLNFLLRAPACGTCFRFLALWHRSITDVRAYTVSTLLNAYTSIVHYTISQQIHTIIQLILPCVWADTLKNHCLSIV